jgi:predicted RNA-binding protein with PIN domain
MKTIIDAYNVIYAWKNKGYLPSTVDIEEFLNLVSILADTEEGSFSVVFDGNHPHKESIQAKYPQIEIIFSFKESSADSVIEKMVQEGQEENGFSVITSDHIEGFIVSGSGARIISPARLWEWVGEAKKSMEKRLSPQKPSKKAPKGFAIGDMLDDLDNINKV